MVHTVDRRSNNSVAGLPLLTTGDLMKLAQRWQTMQPVAVSVVTHETPMRNLKRRLPPEVRQAIVSRYVAGKSAKALSREFDISRDGVRRILRDAGVAIRPQHVITPEAAERIVQLSVSDLTIKQVVEQVGYSFGTVQRVLNKHGGVIRVSPVGRK